MRTHVLSDWVWTRPALPLSSALVGYAIWAGFSKDPWFDRGEDFLVALAITLAALAVIPIFLSWLASPTPVIDAHTSTPKPIRVQELAVHHLAVWNYELPVWIRPLAIRTAPEGCQVRVRYKNAQTGEAMLGGAWLLARWNDNQEPVTEAGNLLSIPAMIRNRRLQSKLFPSEAKKHRNAYPFTVAFVIKREGENGFFHFNDESYKWASDGWLNPEWRMPLGDYRVEVELTGYGLVHPSTAVFRLRNGGTRHRDFILAPWEEG